MTDEQMYKILTDKISDIADSNIGINKCLIAVKIKLSKIEAHCDTASNERIDCLKYRTKIEGRIREAEKVTDKVEELPDKFDNLIKKVFTINGIMVVLLILAGIWLKEFN